MESGHEEGMSLVNGMPRVSPSSVAVVVRTRGLSGYRRRQEGAAHVASLRDG